MVCHNKRISRHRVFDDLAERGNTTKGWFLGKTTSVINHQGDYLLLTPSNTDDHTPLSRFADTLFEKLFGDNGYLSRKLVDKLRTIGMELVTSI